MPTKGMYVTKYALTQGILKLYLDRDDGGEGKYVYGKFRLNDPYFNSYRVGVEAFYELEDAKKRADIMRKRKIETLKKKIKYLEGLKF